MNNRDFSLIKLVVFDFDGVFTDNAVWVNEEGIEMVRCSRSDGFGLQMLREAGVDFEVLSTEENPVVAQRCAKLKISCTQSCKDKGEGVIFLSSKYSVPLEHTAFVGNDINDIPAMQKVGFPLTVADGYPEVKQVAIWESVLNGGNGAVREICEKIVQSRIPKVRS